MDFCAHPSIAESARQRLSDQSLGKKKHTPFLPWRSRCNLLLFWSLVFKFIFFSEGYVQVPNIITSIHLLETWLPGLVLRRDDISNKKKKMDILQSQMLTSFRAHSQTDEACYVSNDFSSVRFNRPSPLSSVFTMNQMSIEKAGRNSRGGECRDEDAFFSHSCFGESKGGIVHLSVPFFSSHTYSIHNISSMFGLTEINHKKRRYCTSL